MKIMIAVCLLLVMAGTAGAGEWIVTEGGVKIRQDRITGCRVTEINDVWGFKLPKDLQDSTGQRVAPGSVLVGYKTEVHYAGEWWTVKRYLVPESQWHRYDKDGQRLTPDKAKTTRTKQRASEFAYKVCR